MGGWACGHLSSLPGASGPVVPTPSRAWHSRAFTCSSLLRTLCSARQLVAPRDPLPQHAFPVLAPVSRGQAGCDPRPGSDPSNLTRIRERHRRVVSIITCVCIDVCVFVYVSVHVPVCPLCLFVRCVSLWFYCMYTYVCVFVPICAYKYLYVHLHVYLLVCPSVSLYCVCSSVSICKFVCMSVYMCVSICASVWTRALRTPPVGRIWPRDVFGLALVIFSTS